MKKLIFSLIILNLAPLAHADDLTVNPVSGWNYRVAAKDSLAQSLSEGAEGFLFHNNEEGQAPTMVSIYKLPLPGKDMKLDADFKVWHKFIFSNPQKAMVNWVNEGTFFKDGAWHYFVEFQTDNSSKINSLAMAVALPDGVRLLLFELPRADYLDNVGPVRVLYRNVKLQLAAQVKPANP